MHNLAIATLSVLRMSSRMRGEGTRKKTGHRACSFSHGIYTDVTVLNLVSVILAHAHMSEGRTRHL